jgi:hypothetical protein
VCIRTATKGPSHTTGIASVSEGEAVVVDLVWEVEPLPVWEVELLPGDDEE